MFCKTINELQLGRLLQRVLQTGIQAEYVLMDTWFTTEPMIHSILVEGLNVIGMVKQLNQRYIYRGKEYTLPELNIFMQHESADTILGSILVSTKKEGIPVKIVFIRNRNKRSECLYLLSTDCGLREAEIVRIYGNRWTIEVFFKASKSLLKLGTEFQGRSYDALVCHTTIVFTRYTLLEWIRRNQNDHRTYGELFYMFCDDMQDMDLTNALKSLMALFVEQLNAIATDSINNVISKLQDWIASQASYIQALFTNLCWES